MTCCRRGEKRNIFLEPYGSGCPWLSTENFPNQLVINKARKADAGFNGQRTAWKWWHTGAGRACIDTGRHEGRDTTVWLCQATGSKTPVYHAASPCRGITQSQRFLLSTKAKARSRCVLSLVLFLIHSSGCPGRFWPSYLSSPSNEIVDTRQQT